MNDPATPPKPRHIVGSSSAIPLKALSVDVVQFQHYLDDCEGSTEEKSEYLELVFQIVLHFVDLGYGIHPLNSAMEECCGQLSETPKPDTLTTPDAVKLTGQQSLKETSNATEECVVEREES